MRFVASIFYLRVTRDAGTKACTGSRQILIKTSLPYESLKIRSALHDVLDVDRLVDRRG